MSQCVGRLCGAKVEGLVPTRYSAEQCKRACAEGSDLCRVCHEHEEKNMAGLPIAKSGWHGRMGALIPPRSHVEGSEWNLDLRAKAAAKTAAAAGGAGAPPAAKAAAKVAAKAEKEAAAAMRAAAVAEKKQATELKRAATAAAKAEAAAAKAVRASEARPRFLAVPSAGPKAKRRQTQRKKKSSSSSSSSSSNSTSSGSRSSRSRSSRSRRSNPVIYRPASAASSVGPRRTRWSPGTPISSNKQEVNANALAALGANLVGLPELA